MSKLSRRNFLGRASLAAALPATGAIVARTHGAHAQEAGHAMARHGHGKAMDVPHAGVVGSVSADANGFDPHDLVRDFDEGVVTKTDDGRTVREWKLVAQDRTIEIAPGVKFDAWTYNGRVPGPTLRAREGELLRVRFLNTSQHPHTIHFHGVHTSPNDGVPGLGPGNIEPGGSAVYEFEAEPFGLHHYHCHSAPLAEHIAKGLYGAFVIDPKEGRPEADELIMVQNGFDTDYDLENDIYAVNSVAFAYLQKPIRVKRDRLVRIYLLNILEYDQINSFHIHGNFFHHFPTGTSLEPVEFTDTVVQGQGQRAILELRFPFTGKYMFHSHKSEFAELGWMGFFEVED